MAASPMDRKADTPTPADNQSMGKPNQSADILSSADEDEEPEKYITGAKLFAVTASVTLISFLLLLDQAILGTAIPQITTTFQSLPDVGWYTGVYPLASAASQPLSGKLYTYFRVKYTFLAFLFVFEIGSLVCGVAPSSVTLIVGRSIAGLGSSGLMNGAMTIIASSTPMSKRAFHTGVMLGISSLGIVSGPLIGGALTEYASWRWCFYINLPIGGCAALFLLFIDIPELTSKDLFSLKLVRKVVPELDLIGFAVLAPAAIMFLLALQFGNEKAYSWNSAVIIGLFCGSGIAAILFVAWEWHMGSRAMIPGHILRHRIVWCSILVNASLMGTMVAGSIYLPVYFQAVKGMGPAHSGVVVLSSILPQLLFSIISGAAVSKLGYHIPWAIYGTLITAVGNGLISTFSPTTTMGTWIGFQIVLGVGRGCVLQMASLAVQNAVPTAQIPISLATLIFAQYLASSVFLAIAANIFTHTLVSSMRSYAPFVDPQEALNAGGSAEGIRKLVPSGGAELDGMLRSYSKASNAVFYLLAALAAVGFVFSWGMGWANVKKDKDNHERESGQMKDA